MLIINGQKIPTESIVGFQQTYTPLEVSSVVRLGPNGTGKKRTLWNGKLSTQIAGNGWIPPGLSGLDTSAPLSLACAAPLSKSGGAAGINIGPSSTRRNDADFTPLAFAILGDGTRQEASLTVASNGDCTITPVTGAAYYLVMYWPILQVLITTPPKETGDMMAGDYSWQLEAEEV